MGQDEVFYTCPHCLQSVSIIVELQPTHQNYIEDCEVCCNPIGFTIAIEEGEVVSLLADSIEQ
ncbi:MAG: CPXCG motif-containing cysteine-rich protein [Schleiferiaceae bacterium]